MSFFLTSPKYILAAYVFMTIFCFNLFFININSCMANRSLPFLSCFHGRPYLEALHGSVKRIPQFHDALNFRAQMSPLHHHIYPQYHIFLL